MQSRIAPLRRAIVAESFLVDYTTDDGIVVVRFVGELDMSNSPYAEEAGLAALPRLDDDGSPIIFDVSELAFCDSSGLRALLVVAAKAASSGHQVTLRRPTSMLRRMVELTDVRHLFIFDELAT
jgi:anti-sigma B factor antagonist